MFNTHVILIGFKHVGKTVIGRALAEQLKLPFADLDCVVENHYRHKMNAELSCRQIMLSHGESYYRELEADTLKTLIQKPSSILSLGGGSALNPFNQLLIEPHSILHVTAPRGIVFERIMIHGRPAFFDPDESPYENFSRLWEERNRIYEKLRTSTVNNQGTVEDAVKQAIAVLIPHGLCRAIALKKTLSS